MNLTKLTYCAALALAVVSARSENFENLATESYVTNCVAKATNSTSAVGQLINSKLNSSDLSLGGSTLTVRGASINVVTQLTNGANGKIYLGKNISGNNNSLIWNPGLEQYSIDRSDVFAVNPSGGADGFYVGATNLAKTIENIAGKAMPVYTNVTFAVSNDVFMVITNDVAVWTSQTQKIPNNVVTQLTDGARGEIHLGRNVTGYGNYSFIWNPSDTPYTNYGGGVFAVNPTGGAEGFYVGESNLVQIISSTASGADVTLVDSPLTNDYVEGTNVYRAVTPNSLISVDGYSTNIVTRMNNGAVSLAYKDIDAPDWLSGVGAFSHGLSVYAAGQFSHAEGYRAQASGDYSHAEGKYTVADGAYSHAEGYCTQATNTYSHAEGDAAKAYGEYSHAEGRGTLATNAYSHAEGEVAKAYGEYSHAEGYNTLASGMCSHAEGCGSQANGAYSHAEGGFKGSGPAPHVYDTHAEGEGSHAEGADTHAVATGSHAEGFQTYAYGECSHAEGAYTTASNNYSHAEGYKTRAYGLASHAEGAWSSAYGQYSHACGLGAVVHEEDVGSFVWAGYKLPVGGDLQSRYFSHGPGTFNINPISGTRGFFIGETNFVDHIKNIVTNDIGGGTAPVVADKRVAMFIIPVNNEAGVDPKYVGFELKATTNNFDAATPETVRLQFYSQSDIADMGDSPNIDKMWLYVESETNSVAYPDYRSYHAIPNTMEFEPPQLHSVVVLVDTTRLVRHPESEDSKWLLEDNEELIWCYLRTRNHDPAYEQVEDTDRPLWRPIAPVKWFSKLPKWAGGI